MTLKQYYKLLKNHDWYYCMSDDHSMYMKGKKSEKELIDIANDQDGEYGELFDAFAAHYDAVVLGDIMVPPLPKEPT